MNLNLCNICLVKIQMVELTPNEGTDRDRMEEVREWIIDFNLISVIDNILLIVVGIDRLFSSFFAMISA